MSILAQIAKGEGKTIEFKEKLIGSIGKDDCCFY